MNHGKLLHGKLSHPKLLPGEANHGRLAVASQPEIQDTPVRNPVVTEWIERAERHWRMAPPLPAKSSALSDQKLTLGDAWLEVFQQVLPRNQFCAAGKVVARAYREEFGEEPPRRQQFVDGAPRQVKSYRRSWLIDTLKRFRAQLTGG